jgi:hypothetical protein
MEKIMISGVPAYNFGKNNYSCDMEAIVFNAQDVSVEEVSMLDNIYLHPICEPNSLEIFALRGTHDNFLKFYEGCIESEMTKQAVKELGYPKTSDEWVIVGIRIDELVSSFKPWYVD